MGGDRAKAVGSNGTRDIVIRPATEADYSRVVEIWLACGSYLDPQGRESREAFTEQIRAFPDSYLVALGGNRVVGVVLGSHDHRKGWINRLAVDPAHQRRGIASALVQACDAALRRHGLDLIVAHIEPHNHASAALFEKLGFREEFPIRYFRKHGT